MDWPNKSKATGGHATQQLLTNQPSSLSLFKVTSPEVREENTQRLDFWSRGSRLYFAEVFFLRSVARVCPLTLNDGFLPVVLGVSLLSPAELQIFALLIL